MATDAATNPAKRDLDFEYDFVSIILQFQTKNDTKLYNICHKTRLFIFNSMISNENK